jgi:tape measure domain-containing protein
VSVVANVAINVDSRAAVSKLRDVQSQAGATQRAFDGLGAAVGKLAVAFAGIQAVKFIFAKTAELESQTRSLEVLTGSAQKAKQIIQELQQLGAVTPFTSTELIDAAKRLQAFGVEANNVVETTKRLADVSGATGAELQGLVTAYGQVQAKGRLQGEELLQFQERGVALQAELRKMYGLSGDEFQKALEKGRISAKAVEVAIQNLTSAGGKYANGAIAQSDTLNGRLSTLQDGIESLARGIGSALSPAIKAVLNEAIFAINTINQLIATGARARSFGLGQEQRKGILNQAQSEAEKIVNLRRVRDPFERNRQFQQLAAQRERDLIEAYGIQTGQVKPAAMVPTAPAGATPALLGATGGGKKKKGKTDAERAAESAARIQAEIQGLQRQTALTKQLTFLDEQIANAEADKNKELIITLQAEEKKLRLAYQLADELARAQTQGQRDAALANATAEADRIRVGAAIEMSKQEEERYERYQDLLTGLDREIQLAGIKDEAAKKLRQIEFDIADLRKEGLYTEEQLLAIQQKRMALITTDTKGPGQKRMEELRTELINLTNLENISITAADNIGTAFGQAFQEIINGSSSAQEALAKMMQSIGENFVSMAAQIIAKQTTMVILGTILKALGIGGGAFGGGGFSSNAAGFGGSVDAGIPALPNIPDYSGAFRANGGPVSAGSPYVVGEHGPELFVPGSSGSVVSNSNLRSAMGAAPGSSGSPVLNMSFQTTSIGGVEYVSREQLEAAMAETRRQATRDGASRGMTMTLDRIKQSPQTRSRIGIR